jgi:hypothetical protein
VEWMQRNEREGGKGTGINMNDDGGKMGWMKEI